MKKRLNLLIKFFTLLLLLAVPLRAADQWTRFGPKPGGKSKVRVEGDSTMHAWRVESPLVGGFIEVGPNFPLTPETAKPGKLDAKVEVFVPVKSLKSLEADGKPYSTRMDDVMYGKLLEPQFKRITYRLTELTLKEAAKSADAPHVCEAVGELVVAGVTNKITMPVNVMVSADKKIRISGSLPSKMSAFKIEPPALTILGMGIKTADDIKLIFEWEVGAS